MHGRPRGARLFRWMVSLALASCLPMVAARAVTPTPQRLSGSAAAAEVTSAWVRLLPEALPAAGYFVLRNTGAQPLQLMGASSPAWAEVSLHRSLESAGESTMMPVASVTVPAHGHVSFAPGGYHLMLMHAATPLKAGNKAQITLKFADGTQLPVDFKLRPVDATGP
ncbi:MAG TPA: copper chaperone PCu(A)C [Nevskiaceae bacterium]|nr:copper chaperone PCu(A)C [Nevskiaceae bacterium]